eukprot:214916_1
MVYCTPNLPFKSQFWRPQTTRHRGSTNNPMKTRYYVLHSLVLLSLELWYYHLHLSPVKSPSWAPSRGRTFPSSSPPNRMERVHWIRVILGTHNQKSSRNSSFLWDIDYWNAFESMVNGILMICGVVGVILDIVNVLCDLEKSSIYFVVSMVLLLSKGIVAGVGPKEENKESDDFVMMKKGGRDMKRQSDENFIVCDHSGDIK